MELFLEFLVMVALCLLCTIVFCVSFVLVDLVPSSVSSGTDQKCGEKFGCGGFDFVHNVIDESPEREKVCEIEAGLGNGDVGLGKDEDSEVLEEFEILGEEAIEGSLDDGEWEGIERTELERRFGSAVTFLGSGDNADRIRSLGRAVKRRLDGLHKIATQGQCWKAQPMALKVSARANWEAWRELGNMSPEVAMEQYITLLSKSIPGWEQVNHGDTR